MVKENLSEITVKNSLHQFIKILISRVGGLIFSIILARMLLPNLFGIYSLALSIVLIILTLTDLGVGGTLMRYISEALGKRNRILARSYFKYLVKLKGLLVSIAIIIVLIFAKILAINRFCSFLLYLHVYIF